MTSIEKDLREKAEKIAHAANAVRLSCTDLQFKKFVFDELESLIPRIVAAVEQAQADAIQSAAMACYGDGVPGECGDTWGWHTKDYYAAIHSLTPRQVQIEAELRKLTVEVVTTKLCGELWDQEKGTAIRELLVQLLAKKDTLERELEAERKGVRE